MNKHETLTPGTSVWMANPGQGLTRLSLPASSTLARKGKVRFPIRLKRGWNQVGNPGLQVLHWPVRRNAPGYLQSAVKGLVAYDPARGAYVHADTLAPWKGYYAYYRGPAEDTLIDPLHASPASPAPKPGSGPSQSSQVSYTGYALRFLQSDAAPVTLGASIFGHEGLGVEDDPLPPDLGVATGPRLWAQRGSARLGMDFVDYVPDGTSRWRVILQTPAGPSAETEGPGG